MSQSPRFVHNAGVVHQDTPPLIHEPRRSATPGNGRHALRKYKDRLIADLPGPYLAWFARKGFPPGELGRLLALMHEIDHNGLSPLLAPLRQRSR
ncbi:hypothetical protein GCM10009097_09730 [Pigmentiphaga daeguensis]|uniref:Cytoplasmic protein n=1 Tax=Pigmentiphaga daeguensis TaxID=414049 RepID=A0ABN1BE48_9BURK